MVASPARPERRIIRLPRLVTAQMLEVESRFGGIPIDQLIETMLRRHPTVGKAATALGIQRPTLYTWCRRFNIKLVTDSNERVS